MANREPLKHTVFLSHSSQDRDKLLALKEALDKRLHGALHLFLSSDDQTIRPGKDWFEALEEGLRQCKLMFCFLSSNFLRSRWLTFEVGFVRAKETRGEERIILVLLDGVEATNLPSPFNRWHTMRMASANDLNQLVRLINDRFEMRHPEDFSPRDYETVWGAPALKIFQDVVETTAVLLPPDPQELNVFRGLLGQKSWSLLELPSPSSRSSTGASSKKPVTFQWRGAFLDLPDLFTWVAGVASQPPWKDSNKLRVLLTMREGITLRFDATARSTVTTDNRFQTTSYGAMRDERGSITFHPLHLILGGRAKLLVIPDHGQAFQNVIKLIQDLLEGGYLVSV